MNGKKYLEGTPDLKEGGGNLGGRFAVNWETVDLEI
jgi:hypothetical protein